MASFGEWLNPFDRDAGFSLEDLPLIGGLFKDACEANENQHNVNQVRNVTDNLLVKVGMYAGGGLLGSYLGKDFGVIGKVGGGLLGAFVVPKLVNEVSYDVAAATDYVEEGRKNGEERSWLSAFGGNVMRLGGQAYTGYTETVSAESSDEVEL